jgi:hypothetical protein
MKARGDAAGSETQLIPLILSRKPIVGQVAHVTCVGVLRMSGDALSAEYVANRIMGIERQSENDL